jgi:hypothetical protein
MQIHFHTDHNIEGSEKLTAHVKDVVEASMDRFGARITRVEVHLGDETSHPNGEHARRCMMEVRLSGHQPTAVIHHAVSVDEAIAGATDKLVGVVESLVGRLDHR